MCWPHEVIACASSGGDLSAVATSIRSILAANLPWEEKALVTPAIARQMESAYSVEASLAELGVGVSGEVEAASDEVLASGPAAWLLLDEYPDVAVLGADAPLGVLLKAARLTDEAWGVEVVDAYEQYRLERRWSATLEARLATLVTMGEPAESSWPYEDVMHGLAHLFDGRAGLVPLSSLNLSPGKRTRIERGLRAHLGFEADEVVEVADLPVSFVALSRLKGIGAGTVEGLGEAVFDALRTWRMLRSGVRGVGGAEETKSGARDALAAGLDALAGIFG